MKKNRQHTCNPNEDIKDKFENLVAIYKENSENSNSMDLTNLAQLNFSTSPNQQYQLMLTPEQSKIKYQLIKAILSNYKMSTVSLAEEFINEFSIQALENIKEIESVSIKMLKKFHELKNKDFTIIKPAIIHILTTKPLIKIIGLDLIPNPIPYFHDYYKDNPRVLKKLEYFKTMFTNKDPYNKLMPDIAAISEIEAIDQVSAENIFYKYSQEVAGFLKLFQPGCDVYFTTLKPKELAQELVIQGVNVDSYNGFTPKTKFDRAGINDTIYEEYLDRGLKWLNDNINSDKAKKMRDALYWFNFATDEMNLTNKFIYLITVLECILKPESQTVEVATTIAERTAFILGKNKADKISIFKEMKKVYDRRSKIVHNGATLVINEELMVFETHEKVRDILIKLLKDFSNPDMTFENFIDTFLDNKFADKI
ncbi:MAG: hypothetical protein K0R94_537 [Burkholderiales bacterium]|jgi:hypothetical protein|nr:hypothetical protein [Burkholderiales bacterium]